MAGKYFLFKYEAGDIVTMRKKHPCGSKEWELTSVGMDVKMTCKGCQRQMVMNRQTLEKSTAMVMRDGKEVTNG